MKDININVNIGNMDSMCPDEKSQDSETTYDYDDDNIVYEDKVQSSASEDYDDDEVTESEYEPEDKYPLCALLTRRDFLKGQIHECNYCRRIFRCPMIGVQSKITCNDTCYRSPVRLIPPWRTREDGVFQRRHTYWIHYCSPACHDKAWPEF
jgi:hypothetical protein